MYIPKPPMTVALVFQNLDKFLVELENVGDVVGGVGVFGSAAAYALVWELGAANKKPGPKTQWGTNRYGQKRIFSTQAPEGYIGVISDQFWPIIEEELGHLKFRSSDTKGIRLEMEVVVDNAMQRIARLISDNAPVDTGDLRVQIQYIDSSDPTLQDAADLESEGTLIL